MCVQGVGRMGKEVDILSSLSHPHIVQYYESFVEGPHLYIAMELVEVGLVSASIISVISISVVT